MPANRMNAPAGSSKLNVIGSSSAIVSAGPIPGSTPISVPERHADRRQQQVLGREHGAEAVEQIRGEHEHQTPQGPCGSCTFSHSENTNDVTAPITTPISRSRAGFSEPSSQAASQKKIVVASA